MLFGHSFILHIPVQYKPILNVFERLSVRIVSGIFRLLELPTVSHSSLVSHGISEIDERLTHHDMDFYASKKNRDVTSFVDRVCKEQRCEFRSFFNLNVPPFSVSVSIPARGL